MPVVAVIGGIASATAGVAAFGAAATTMGSIMAGLQIVGGVASALGGLTGNKKLQKFGMFASLGAAAVGGISSLVSGSSSASTALSAGDTGLGLASGGGDLGLQAADTGLSGIGIKGSEIGGLSGGVGSELASLNTGVSSTSPWATAGSAPAAGEAVASAGGAGSGGGAGGTNYDMQAPTSGVPGLPQTTTDSINQARGMLKITPADTGAGAFQGFSSFLNKNPELTKVGMGMLSGFGQSYMQEQKLKEEARVREADRARFNASITGQRQTY